MQAIWLLAQPIWGLGDFRHQPILQFSNYGICV